MALSSLQIREQIQRYLSGVLALDDFEDWLVGASWNMHQNADRDVQQLVGAVELRLAEHSQGHLDDNDLKHELQMILNYGYQVPMAQMPTFLSGPQISVTTVSSTLEQPSTIQSVVVAGDRMTTSETRSASSRTVSAREALQGSS